jgi:DNA-binding MarR family transcriptional regulator
MNFSTEVKPKMRHWLSREHQLWANILFTGSWLKHSMTEILADLDLTVQQARIMIILHENKGMPLSTNNLRERILEMGSDTPKLVNRLVEKGLVDKKISENDKRYLDITLTDKGEEMMKIILKQKMPAINSLLTDLIEEERDTLIELLMRIHKVEILERDDA